MSEISAKICLDIFVLNNAVEFFRPAAPPLSQKRRYGVVSICFF